MAVNQRKTTPNPMPDREILNIDGAAAFLGVSVKTFSKVLREGDVPGRKVGREWKFARQALIDWIGTSRSRTFLDEADGGRVAEEPALRRRPARGRRVGAAAADGAGADAAGGPGSSGGGARRRGREHDAFSVDEI